MTAENLFTEVHLISELPENTPVLLALSGGADSRALLDLLLKYSKRTGAPVSVAHVNHMIRGKDAERDRDFCRALADKHGLPFYLLEADVPAMAKASGRGLEEEAREVRYAFFEELMKKHSIPILATAHNATDNAETVLFNLIRGSGLHGLCGIPEKRSFGGGIIVRPILKMPKETVLEYCSANSLEYVSDATNQDVSYSRNRIRNNVLPQLKEINNGAVLNISRACEALRTDDAFLERAAKEFISAEKKDRVSLKSLSGLDRAVASRAVLVMLNDLFKASSTHVESVLELAKRAVPHSSLTLPDGVFALIENGELIITTSPPQKETAEFDLKLCLGENKVPGCNCAIYAEADGEEEKNGEDHARLKNIYKNSTTAVINFDRINIGLFARSRREGDAIISGGMHKKLKKLFCDKKIPLDMRAATPIVYCDDGIVWIPRVALKDGERSAPKKLRLTFYYNT